MKKIVCSLLAVMAVVVALAATAFAQTIFPRAFAPEQGWVFAPERPYREDICLNGSWKFQSIPVPTDYKRNQGTPPALPQPTPDRWETTRLKVPSPWNVNRWTVQGRGDHNDQPYHTDSVYFPSYPRSWDNAEMGWLQRSFRVPASWSNRRALLHFEAVAGECQVWINGRKTGEHFDSFLPFDLDITDFIRRGAENELRVGVRAAHLFNKQSTRYEAFRAPYAPGSTLDHITGIWQDVFLVGVPAVRVSDTFVQPLVDKGLLVTEVTVRNDTNHSQSVRLGGTVHPWVNLAGHDILSAPESKWRLGAKIITLPLQTVQLPARTSRTLTLRTPIKNQLRFWTPDNPNLYGVVFYIAQNNRSIDLHYTRFGWRQFKIVGRELRLNGKNIQLFGDLLHPFGPFIGSRRYAWSWYKMIKDFGGNAVRPHAQPAPRHFLDLADEMGICVLDETALFGSSIQINFEDPKGWDRFNAHYDGLVMRDRNHPSVFGWSCGNELFAQFLRIPESKQPPFYEKLSKYAQRSRRLDPTRDWISCDGDEDLRGTLPVWSKHYGHGIPNLPKLDKPQMVGESGGTYYATPTQLATFNGDRAYESYIGRNEALAIDAYQNIVQMVRPNLAYFSASETAWFGIEHLALGYHDHTRRPNQSDGIFFQSFEEGKPGIQPERIPPYTMTFNPGLDPKLPLYKPLPMFDAMQAALAKGGPKPSPWDHKPVITPHLRPKIEATISQVAFAGDRNSELFQQFDAQGVPFVSDAEQSHAEMLIIDGAQLKGTISSLFQKRMNDFLARGGTVLIPFSQQGTDVVNQLLPAPVQFTTRTATALVPRNDSIITANFGLPDLYFAEDNTDRQIIKCGLTGPFVKQGQVLLEASNTDWSLFNDRSEEEKCSNILIYEQMIKPAGAALVELPKGQGRILLSTIDYRPDSETYTKLWRQLFLNIGVQMQEPRNNWILPTALATGPAPIWRYTTSMPGDGWEQTTYDDTLWKSGEAGFGTDPPGSRSRTSWTNDDIWLRSSFVLKEDDNRGLKLHVYHDEDVEVYINGTRIFSEPGHTTEYKVYPISPEARKAFHTGSNTIAVHCHQTAGGQYIDVGLSGGKVPTSATPIKEHNLLLNGPVN